jgi:nitrite reductase/ring-hydroxylating ferredoxin subunit
MMTRKRWIKIYDFAKHGMQPQHPNSVRTIDAEGFRLSLCYDGSTYHALEEKCPHAGARFGAGGWCEAGMMVCPVHRYKYDLKTGRGLQGDYVETYPTEVRKDGVYVGIPTKVKWWWPFG